MTTKPTTRLRTATGFAAILTGIMLSMVALAIGPAAAADVNPTAVYDIADGPGGNTTCAAALAGQAGAPATTTLGGAGGFTSNGSKTDGVLSVDVTGFPGALSFSVTGVDPAVRVYAVLIKETNSTRVYYYAAGVPVGDSDSGLGGPNGGVSNYKLCYAVPAPPPPPLVEPVTPPVVEPVTPPVVEPVTPPAPEVLPEVITPPVVPAAPEEPESEVLGVVVERQLPVTGSTTLPLLQVGFGLILLGAGAVLFGRERPALI